jgi:hypothetical protein
MLPNSFIGKRSAPTDGDVSEALGPAKALWDRLVSDLSTGKTIDNHEWNSYSPKAGWSLKLKRGERTILYLSPCKYSFRASFALGDKAVKAALDSKLPANVLTLIREAKRYAEGTAVRIEVKSAKDLDVVNKLAAAKLSK